MKLCEGWLEFNNEQRHTEYYFCSHCKSVYNLLGDRVTQLKGSSSQLKLTLEHS